jgi:hypothetical protein
VLRRRGQREDLQRLRRPELWEGHERSGEVLPQPRAQAGDLALASPHHALMGSGQRPQGLQALRVGGQGAVVVAIGPDQVGEHLGVGRVRLGPRGGVSLAVAGHGQRVQRIEGVAGGQQPAHEQPALGLDADHHLLGRSPLAQVRSHQLMHPPKALQAVGHAGAAQGLASLVHEQDVVIGLSPVHPQEQHLARLPLALRRFEPEETSGDRMVQCSVARHPTSRLSPRRPAGARSSPTSP